MCCPSIDRLGMYLGWEKHVILTEIWLGKLEKWQLRKMRMRWKYNFKISVRYVGV